MMRYIFIVLGLVVLIGCTPQTIQENATAEAIDVVTGYYTALNNKDYRTMYGFISDGFKEIEPTAKTYEDFEAYTSKFFDTADGIRVKSTKVASATKNEYT